MYDPTRYRIQILGIGSQDQFLGFTNKSVQVVDTREYLAEFMPLNCLKDVNIKSPRFYIRHDIDIDLDQITNMFRML